MSRILIRASEIAKAYNKVKHHLTTMEVKGCCPSVSDKVVVMNEMVVLRQMLELLGFDDIDIDKHIHDTGR